MELPPLVPGRILRRYKRFLADIELENGDVVVAHCPNTGAMTGCWAPGAPVQISASTNPRRKLAWTLERVNMGNGWIGVNTARVNRWIGHFIEQQAISDLAGYSSIQAEPIYQGHLEKKSRFDFVLSHPDRQDCYVEVKNTTLLLANDIAFPDSVSVRGQKHLKLLGHAAGRGYRCVMLYAVNRPEGSHFRPAREIDPVYADELAHARSLGVETIALRIEHTETGVSSGALIPFIGE